MNSDFDTLSSIVSSLTSSTHTYTEYLTIFYCLTLKKYMKIIESRDSDRCVYTHVHGGIIHRSKNVQATQVSINTGMDKQNVA